MKMHIHFVESYDAEEFSDELDEALGSIQEDGSVIQDIKYSTCADDEGDILYSALIMFFCGEEDEDEE
jgi:hypothetical protein